MKKKKNLKLLGQWVIKDLFHDLDNNKHGNYTISRYLRSLKSIELQDLWNNFNGRN